MQYGASGKQGQVVKLRIDGRPRSTDSIPVAVEEIDAVVIGHAHIDHSGRVPLLVKRGYEGPIYTQHASKALCEIMLPDSGFLNEKNIEWDNKKRKKNGEPLLEALYTQVDAEKSLAQIVGVDYETPTEILPGLSLTLYDAGHILGSSIVELTYTEDGRKRVLAFSGDLGYRDAPMMNPPVRLRKVDVVLLESTYGDRLHRSFDATIEELTELFNTANPRQGNILIPAFTVGRLQDLLYLMLKNEREWGLEKWRTFVDSPMGIEATSAYAHYRQRNVQRWAYSSSLEEQHLASRMPPGHRWFPGTRHAWPANSRSCGENPFVG